MSTRIFQYSNIWFVLYLIQICRSETTITIVKTCAMHILVFVLQRTTALTFNNLLTSLWHDSTNFIDAAYQVLPTIVLIMSKIRARAPTDINSVTINILQIKFMSCLMVAPGSWVHRWHIFGSLHESPEMHCMEDPISNRFCGNCIPFQHVLWRHWNCASYNRLVTLHMLHCCSA